ncbi:hypothetical protein FRC02_001306 [Tulasnella sp. 418]|nr:hypothetical protein FRC02_001306 [Tulasnella sp. 418]
MAWEKRQKELEEGGQCPWAPFSSNDEWLLSRWLMKSGISQEMIDEFLKLNIIRTKLQPSFKNKYEFLQKIDQLPTGPRFKSKTFSITGDLRNAKGQMMTEVVEMYYRDPVEVVEELISRPSLRDHLTYSPMKIYTSPARQNRIYMDMSSGDWWYDIQDKLIKGATVVPVIIATDKTALTNFSGDKVAYPVYLTIGNASKSVRGQPSQFVTVVIGYLPVPSLACCSDDIRSLRTYQLFHTCMKKIMEPLERCGREGKKMACADRNIRNVFTIVAAHMADAPEQCLIACCQENHCPRCLVPPDQRGSLLSFDSRQPDAILSLLRHSDNPDTETKAQLKAYGLRPVFPPFWAQLPHANIFSSLTPDLLHQIHKGVFKDHLVKWCTSLMACGELDYRYMSMPRHPALRQFKTGIAKVKQWTGKEFKMMERVFIGAIAGGTNRQRVLEAARALLDFIYLSQFPVHTSDTLDKMSSFPLQYPKVPFACPLC